MALRTLEIADGFASVSMPSDIALPLGVISGNLYFNYATTSVGPTNWVQLIASTLETKRITWMESGGNAMEIAIGAVGFETRLFVVPPGGFNGEINLPIPVGSRLSIRCLEAGITSSAGIIIANFIK
jgi:hypothetical protein